MPRFWQAGKGGLGREENRVVQARRWWPVEPLKVGGCAVCALHRRIGVSLGMHSYKGVIHRGGSE
jgi:hypothetical protein